MYNPDGVAFTNEELLEKTKKTRIINHTNTRFNIEIMGSLKKNSYATLQTPASEALLYTSNSLNPAPKIGVDGE